MTPPENPRHLGDSIGPDVDLSSAPSLNDEGAIAIVIGGTSGIGAAIVECLAKRRYRVMAMGLESSGQRTVESSSVRYVIADAQDASAIERLMEAAKAWGQETHTPISALLHVAGGSGRRFGDGPLDQISIEGWRATLAWNLDTVFYSNREIVRHWLEQGTGGAVVNLGSILATHPAPSHFATHAYATAKAGLIGLTRAAASHYAPNNIRFNAILPGLIDTPMATRAINDPQIMRYLQGKQPLGQGGPGQAMQVASTAAWLVSPEAAWITGQCIAVDGGWSVSEPRIS